MTILLNVLLLVLGFAMLVKGADWFVEGSSGCCDYAAYFVYLCL